VTSPLTTPDQLLGTWVLRRRLIDRRMGVTGTVDGTLRLRNDGHDQAVVVWEERGVLLWQDKRIPVSRELLLRRLDGGDWTVHFADGRLFHPWRPGIPVEHPCRADLYCGLVRVDRGATRLRVLWDVSGPAKDQRILSRAARHM